MWCHSGSIHHLYTVHYVRCDEQEAVSPLDWLYMLVQSCFWGHLLVVRKDCRFKAWCYSHLLYTVCGRGSFLTFFVFLLCKDLRFVLSCVKTMTLLWNHIQPLALHTHIISSIYLYWELACMAKNNLVLNTYQCSLQTYEACCVVNWKLVFWAFTSAYQAASTCEYVWFFKLLKRFLWFDSVLMWK